MRLSPEQLENIKGHLVGQVIQLDPDYSHGWGPLLCIVEDCTAQHVLCYALHVEERHKPPSRMYLHIAYEGYELIGPAKWVHAPTDVNHDPRQ